jgi:hypothetical protein
MFGSQAMAEYSKSRLVKCDPAIDPVGTETENIYLLEFAPMTPNKKAAGAAFLFLYANTGLM